MPDGRQEQIHHLPDANLTYEVEEVRNGKRVRWYGATVEGDDRVHRISPYGAELYAKRLITIADVIANYPEMPLIEVEEE